MVDNELAGDSISALGWSGRDDLNSVLEELMKREDNGYNRRFSGAILQAAFYRYTIERYGYFQAVEEVHSSFDRSIAEFIKWRESPDGKPWGEWSDRVNRQRW